MAVPIATQVTRGIFPTFIGVDGRLLTPAIMTGRASIC
jgi:hypothetical protein